MRVAVCLALAVAAAACTRATVIGTPCDVDRDCNVPGQRCVAGPGGTPRICTHACNAQTGANGCPIGYDCAPADPTRPDDLTCNRETYAFDALTGAPLLFGKDCSLYGGTTQAEWDVGCARSGDPAANPTCRHAPDPDSRATPTAPVRNDAHAYCTGACAADSDCPVEMRCAVDYDGLQKCLRRQFCDPCLINDDCAFGEFTACVPTADGSSRYCSKPCGAAFDCGGVQGHFLSCTESTDALGQPGLYCLHKFGACVGTGEICDPCRADTDCKVGTRCLLNLATGERMCTRPCMLDSECASNKPTGCDYGPPPVNPGDPIYTDLCTGDALHQNPGVLTCFF
jgi:hypothetical protein